MSVKIFETEVINTTNGKPGTLYTDGKKYIEISCGNGGLRLKVLQLPGKKRLSAEELLRGFSLTEDFICR